MSLDRFVKAQDSPVGGFADALQEIERGRKTTHWIWYVFPQIAGLGCSSMAQVYAIRDLDEAVEYLRHPVLAGRLFRATAAVAAQLRAGVALRDLMGGELDAMKLVSSLTLFERAATVLARDATAAAELRGFTEACAALLAEAARQGLPRCSQTLAQT